MSVLTKVLQKYGMLAQGSDKSAKSDLSPPSVAFGTPPDEHSQIFEALRPRLIQMAQRWAYAPDDLAGLLECARRDPVKWHLAVDLDEAREGEFRAARLLL